MEEKIMQTFLWILGSVVGLYLVLVGVLYIFQSGMMYHPSRQIYHTPNALQLEYEDIYFRSVNDWKTHAWFVPAKQARATVLLSHGNAGNISDRLETIRILNSLNLNVFIYDYSGYGKSEGRPSEETTYRNANDAWNYLVDGKRIPPHQIILMGRSLGGAVAAWLAVKREPAALMLESTFTSAADLAAEIYPFLPVRLMMKFEYPTIEYLRQISIPVMVLHSEGDRLVPIHHGRELYNTAENPKTFFEMKGAHGNSHVTSGDEYINAVDQFVSSVITSE